MLPIDESLLLISCPTTHLFPHRQLPANVALYAYLDD